MNSRTGKHRKTSRHSILFGLGAMNRIDQASIMQKYFQLLTTIIWHVGFSSGKWNPEKAGGRRRKAHGEIRWNGGKIPGKKAAKAGEKQRRAEEARCQEEEAKRGVGEEQRAREEQKRRRMEEEEKRKGEKENLKHEKCPWQRCFKRQTPWVEFKLAIEFRQRWRAVLPWVDTASRKCFTYPLFLLWLTSVSWDRWRSHEGDNLGRVWGCALLWLHLLA